MASPQRQASLGSGSDSGPQNVAVGDRKRKRMESNRESARRSRMKKQKQLEDLIGQVTQLQSSNSELTAKISATTQNYMEVNSKNNVLRAQLMELTDRLQSLNSVLEIVEEVSGLPIDIPEIPEPLRQPWQVPFPIQPILANVNMFEC
ncbi:bZIP transcription factor 53-like [Punica granatum]|uniref:BZIP domain-containing protein n=2 Tax=Punica granatum TaxID=22663 RepID=A0A218VQT1_PUNGR|nr:bZIP transcription factor 53-like [Punica granatum]OWM62855.1 hypothetical protein CDL15_Pgr020149 [Punica granatum]PKI48182.1 hypothetical protein CRG98_031447 [Punica granatum]